MRKAKRVFLIVLDSLGIGAAEDAALFGDASADTLGSVVKHGGATLPNLAALGLGCIDGVTAWHRWHGCGRGASARIRRSVTLSLWES